MEESKEDKRNAPDLERYHKSLALEIQFVRNRVRDLCNNNYESGAAREAILRSVLRRHIPTHLRIGTGFIATHESCSTQIDVLICDGAMPCLFRDETYMIVGPEPVRALIEVKTR